MLLPEDHRARRERDNLLELASGGCCTPGTLETGYRYAEMGYTAAFEPAMLAANARQAHMEMGDTPILDHGAYVMLGNEEVFLEMLARGEDFERIRDYVGWSISASKAMGVKVVDSAAFRLQVQPAQARRGREPCVRWRSHRAGWCIRWRTRAARAGRAASAASTPATLAWPATSNPRSPPSTHWRACPATSRISSTPTAPKGEEILLGHPPAHREAQGRAQRQHRRRPDHLRPDRHRLGRHHAPVRQCRPGRPAQVRRRRHRVRCRLRRRAFPLPRAELRQCVAVGDRAGALPAHGRPGAWC
ncbi:hypothetical protein [Thauera humireducens]|uniref:hypothetical protein n=1 Tax=Thauera humireducens TaxID=1134435 RepID=UPI003C78BF71